MKDHLGNSRLSFDIFNNAPREVQHDDYYPFGKAFNSWTFGQRNNYLYNSKELQGEWGRYDYGARFYDSVTGRFNTVDRLSEVSRRFSPYIYGNNNPIRFIDPDGMAVEDMVDGVRYTGDDAISAFNQLKSQLRSSQNSDGGKKKKGKDKVPLSGSEQIAIGLRNYGGDYSGSAFDWAMYSLDQLNQFNPIANVWDGITGSIDGTDRLGNPQSDFETGLKYASSIPIGKVAGAVANAAEKVELAVLRKGIATALSNSNNISHIMQSKHGLEGILKIAGSEKNVVRKLFLSLGQQSSLPASGNFERIISVYGKQVTVRGAVVSGIPRISTAFIP